MHHAFPGSRLRPLLAVALAGGVILALGGGARAAASTTTTTAPPVSTAPPTISGSTADGSTLSCSNGAWSGPAALSWSYQWLAGAVAISGATSSTYTTGAADAGESLSCTVTEETVDGSASATSAAVTIGAAPDVTVPSVLPVQATLAATLKGEIVFDFSFPVGGTLRATGTASPLARASTITYGSAKVTAIDPGAAVFELKPTKAGDRLLTGYERAHRPLVVTVTLAFTPLGGVAASIATEQIVVHGR